MKHEIYKEWILLSVLGELAEKDRGSLKAHLEECAGCRAELEDVKSFMTLVGEAGAAGPSDEMLREARRSLRVALSKEAGLAERAAVSPNERLTKDRAWSGSGPSSSPAGVVRGWSDWLSPSRAVLAGAAAVAIGFFAGYLVFGRMGTGVVGPRPSGVTESGHELGSPSYQNVRLAGVDPRTSEVELEYEMIRPVRLKAAIDDERVQRVLAQAVVNDDNPGTRLQAINTIGAYSAKPVDMEIKRALIRAVETDPNVGVRKQALQVLYQMPFDDDVKKACLHVLAADENEGLRIAAINMLAVAVLDGRLEGKEVIDAVGARLQDDNSYIRIRSGTFLQEVNGNGE